tara:strand:- start:194 stop:445 length:252 start_codon:yes stop_codon:yes gene_type:complete
MKKHNKKINLSLFIVILSILTLINPLLAHASDDSSHHMMEGMMYGSGMWIFCWIFIILIIVALVLFIIWMIKQIQGDKPRRRK